MPDTVSIASFDQFEAAEALARRLSEEGFEAEASSDSAEQLLKFYNVHPRAHCHVKVQSDRIEEALKKVRELDATEEILRAAVHCPECGSTQVEFPQFSRKTIIGALPAVAAAAGIIDWQFYCFGCQFTWTPSDATTPAHEPGKDMLR